jgi:hypothetical protein
MLFYTGCIIEEPAMENPTLVFLPIETTWTINSSVSSSVATKS